jgi:YegS/Rv2252/BmrU family lipid kinase
MHNSFAVILNASSGAQGSEEKLGQLREALAGTGVKAEIFLAHGADAVILSVQKALAAGHRLVVAAGGDGTANAVASGLLGSGATLGILPLGTLNHLARDLGIPQDLAAAAAVLLNGKVANIDVGRVNDRIFLNNSSIGIYPKLVRYRDEQQAAGSGKWLAVGWALLRVLQCYSFLEVALDVDGRQLKLRSPFIFVGNNQYELRGLTIGTRSQLTAGRLSVYVAHHFNRRLGLVILAWSALRGRLLEHQAFSTWLASSVIITTRRKFLHVALDGEVETLATPLRYQIIPKGLPVMVPKAQP